MGAVLGAAVVLVGGVWSSAAVGSSHNGRGAFMDDDGSVHESDINGLAEADITRGCNPPANSQFCPTQAVTRGQMASFLVRALDLPGADTNPFGDVAGIVYESDIAALAAADITRGCNPPSNDRFCPQSPVTREQMASFLVRALNLSGSDTAFTDISGSVHSSDIQALAAAGITKGCNPPDNTRFCPEQAVTRQQMASFLVRALDDVEAVDNRLSMRTDLDCAKDGSRCTGRANLSRGTDLRVSEGWYQVMPYRDGEESAFTSDSTTVTFTWNGNSIGSQYTGLREGDARATRLWEVEPPELTAGTHTLRAVWRWNGLVTQRVTYTITVP